MDVQERSEGGGSWAAAAGSPDLRGSVRVTSCNKDGLTVQIRSFDSIPVGCKEATRSLDCPTNSFFTAKTTCTSDRCIALIGLMVA